MKILLLLVLFVGGLFLVKPAEAEYGDECNDPVTKADSRNYYLCLENAKKKIDEEYDRLLSATKPLESELKRLDANIKSLQAQLNTAVAKQKELAKEISLREGRVAEHYVVFAKKTRELYKKKRGSTMLVQLLSVGAGKLNREIAYQTTASNQDRQLIIGLAEEIISLEEDKKGLDDRKSKLSVLQASLDKQAEFFRKEVAKSKEYQEVLGSRIAALSKRQEEILAERNGAFIASVGDSELADDYNASIKGFRESAPSGYFAVFSFGGYTHRKGMSQYGARGRAQSGQNFRDILKAYYGREPVNKDTGGTISVAGYGNLDFETTYLWGIAEVPSTWHSEALKAQAVAARTYAYRYKIEGKQICTTENCQVFRKSKADNPPAEWRQAVIDTRGQVLEDVVTYYSSTTGVYLTTMGWDTTDGGGGGNFVDKSYEKFGGSPWVYKAWYTKEYSPNSAKCGRENPWLSPEEMADIANAALVLTKGSDSEASRISPVTTNCWGGNPYSHEELRNVASKYGGISSASSVSAQQGQGQTGTVTINGISFSGEEFKKAFNLRAPGYLKIPQKGFAFFNIEKK
ncbi:hypothetical protein HYS10_01835 [Candidatus Collierbacteria bacterium]|nr:hypothetical protein [Candidatus Collierbacteria bacterium]